MGHTVVNNSDQVNKQRLSLEGMPIKYKAQLKNEKGLTQMHLIKSEEMLKT